MMIRMDGVTVYPPQHHAPDRPLLQSVNTSFEAGSITLLAGRSGSGKSTFLHTLAGLIPMAQGGIRYGDIPLWTEKQRIHPQACASVGIAFQYPERQLFAENVRKELAYSLRPLRWSKQDKERAIAEALQSVNLPLSILDEPVLSLSEGTKRKVAFAATVIGKPQWLLLDEPTSGMDSKGIQPLLRLLQAHSAAGGGVIVASHDLETFLPIADRVILLKDGAMAADLTPQQCCDAPELLARAEMGWPEQVRLTAALRAHGFPVGSCALTPEEAAAAIIERLRSAEAVPLAASTSPHAAANAVLSAAAASAAEKAETAAASAYQLLDADMASTAWPETGAVQAERLPTHKGGTDEKRAESFIDRLHPIAKWICYISLSAGVLMQHHWMGIAAAAALCAIIAAVSGNPSRIIGGKAVRFFAIFIVISSLLSGLRIELSPLQLGFEAGPALVTVKLLLRYLLIMALGLLLMATTGEQQMQTALEQALHPLERFKFPARLVTFAATLMLRFVTMLNMEIERLSLIVTARGKAYVKPGTIRLRDVRLFFIPLLLSMMKHAEDLAFALEARGYKPKTTSAYAVKPISFELRDNLTVATGLVLLIVMWIMG